MAAAYQVATLTDLKVTNDAIRDVHCNLDINSFLTPTYSINNSHCSLVVRALASEA